MTTIAQDTRINGRIEGDADVTVEGRVDGTIALSETLTVAEGGFVSGDIEAQVVVIDGYASGTLRASSVVHLRETAQVEGEIFANAVRVDPGARFKGRVEMDVEAAPPLPARPERPARTQPSAKKSERSEPKAAEPEPAKTSKSEPEPAPKKSNGSKNVEFDPDELTVKELREMLTDRGLPLSGTKSELVQRLRTGE